MQHPHTPLPPPRVPPCPLTRKTDIRQAAAGVAPWVEFRGGAQGFFERASTRCEIARRPRLKRTSRKITTITSNSKDGGC